MVIAMTDIVTVGIVIVLLISCIYVIVDTAEQAVKAGIGTQFLASLIIAFILSYVLFYTNVSNLGG